VYLIKNYYYTEQNDLSNKKDTKIPWVVL
jgi:hypothetical protein